MTNLIDFYNEMTRSVDDGMAVHVIKLDFSKAFDTSILTFRVRY